MRDNSVLRLFTLLFYDVVQTVSDLVNSIVQKSIYDTGPIFLETRSS